MRNWRTRKEGPEKCGKSIVRCTLMYVCIYVPIPGGSTCPRSLKPHTRILFSSLSSSFALAWYAPVDKSRPLLLKDRGIGDKPESQNGDRAGGTAKSHPLRRDRGMIELNSRATRYSGKFTGARRRYDAVNEEQRRSRRCDYERSNCILSFALGVLLHFEDKAR